MAGETRRLAAEWSADRPARQRRQELDRADFDRLRRIGYPLAAVPVELGGHWVSVRSSTRPVCGLLRHLAQGDSSVALVAAMHPAVLTYWLTSPGAHERSGELQGQLSVLCAGILAGDWWGTITSEPGSGGDISRTKAIARRGASPDEYLLSGVKHFGSGCGITTHMVTTAVPEGEPEADWFYVDLRGVCWDGRQGVELVAPWEGQGMRATQSHSLRFEAFPATRFAAPGNLLQVAQAAGGPIGCFFAAVIVGIVQAAMFEARRQLESRRESMRPFERVEWTKAEVEAWTIEQAYEGMIRASEESTETEESAGTPFGVRCGKAAIAELAEALLGRLCRVLGGGTYTRHSPFAYWFEDVRALGFLRPPWALAFDALFAASWDSPGATGASGGP